MKVILDIKDNRATAFINFIKSLDFINIQTKEGFEEPTKKEILESIERGLKEAQLHSEGKVKLQSARDFLDEL